MKTRACSRVSSVSQSEVQTESRHFRTNQNEPEFYFKMEIMASSTKIESIIVIRCLTKPQVLLGTKRKLITYHIMLEYTMDNWSEKLHHQAGTRIVSAVLQMEFIKEKHLKKWYQTILRNH